MPGADFARIFGTVLHRAESRAKSEEDKNNKAKQEDIQMYQKVLFDPNSSPEQRQKASDQITKLRGLNKKDSPFGKLAGMLNHVSAAKQQQPATATSAGGEVQQPSTATAATATSAGGEAPKPETAKPESNVRQPQEKKQGGGAMAALGRMFSGQGLIASHPQELPPLDPSIFPTATDIATAQKNAEKITHVNQFKQVSQDFKEAFGREMTQEEIDTHFKLSPPARVQFKQVSQDFKEAFGREMTQKEIDTHFKLSPPARVITKLVQDGNSKTGWSFVSSDAITGEEYSRQLDAPPQRGLTTSETDTTSTDPAGQKTTTHTVRKPVLGSPGKSGADTSPKRQLTPLSPPKATAGHPNATSTKTGVQIYDKYGLDERGHIPDNSPDNPQIRTLANQLLDGQDVGKLKGPSKDVLAAQPLAEKYGWSQGKFTPKEQVMLRESTTFLKSAASDQALKALDGDFMQRMKMAQVAKNPDKEGMLGRGLSVVAAQNLSEDQKNFIQIYNQLVGTISGLAQLVRSGRATEATIERLKAELPNPVSTKDSKDAKERIQRILKEVDVAMEKGTFTGQDSGSKKPSNVEEILRKHKVLD